MRSVQELKAAHQAVADKFKDLPTYLRIDPYRTIHSIVEPLGMYEQERMKKAVDAYVLEMVENALSFARGETNLLRCCVIPGLKLFPNSLEKDN